MLPFAQVNDQTFQQEVFQSALPVLVEFGAEWCVPCKRMEPVLAELANQWQGRVRLAKLDVDESIQVTVRYQVMSVPTLILFIRGEESLRLVGLQSHQRILEKVSAKIAGN